MEALLDAGVVQGGSLGTPASAAPGHKESVVENTYRLLKAKIINNDFPPGYQMLEREVAESFGVSRTPVREILTRLQEEGLVERLPRRGFRVLPLTPDDIRQLAEVITALEGLAGELLAARHFAEDSPEWRHLVAASEAAEAALARDDRPGWAYADREFHRSILMLCGNRHLARAGFAAWDQFHRADMITLKLRPKPEFSPVEHRAILEAFRSGDSRRARECLAAHRRSGRESIVQTVEKYGLRHI
jgi:DNA-binding GntR family transcriptional regulator